MRLSAADFGIALFSRVLFSARSTAEVHSAVPVVFPVKQRKQNTHIAFSLYFYLLTRFIGLMLL